MRKDDVLLEAKFDEKLKLYWLLNPLWLMLITVFGIPFIPIWLLGLGQYICARRFANHRAHLTTRSLYIRTGYWFKVEKHIPLDKIQDLTLREGPILRSLGLAALSVETAGQSQQGGPDASLAGLMDAVDFRDAVMAQRDALIEGRERVADLPEHAQATAEPPAVHDAEVLTEIRDVLLRIETKLDRES